MLRLANGADVKAAYIVPGGDGMKPHGIVLAEHGSNWVVWNIYWDGETGVFDDPPRFITTNEVWQAETGDYFHKNKYRAFDRANFQFGRRLYRMMTEGMWSGAFSAH